MTFEEKTQKLGRLQREAAENGIILCLENTEETVDVLKSVFMAVPELRFCLDVGHANLFSSNPLDFIHTFKDRLEHLHLSDNRGGNAEKDDLHLLPGEGSVDFTSIFSILKKFEYDGTVTLELHPRFDVNAKIESLRWLQAIRVACRSSPSRQVDKSNSLAHTRKMQK